MSSFGARVGAVALSLVFTLTSCTDEQPVAAPSPSPQVTEGELDDGVVGARVWAVVLPPPRTVDHDRRDAYRDAVAGAVRGDTTFDRSRVLEPEGAAFRRDLLRLLAEEGTSYVCAVGGGASSDVLAVARDHPDVNFCTVGDRIESPPENVFAVDVRTEELAYLAGVAAAGAAQRGTSDGEAAPTLGFVAERANAHTEGQRKAFTEGARRIIQDVRVVAEFVGNVDTDEERDRAAGIVAGQYNNGAAVVYVASDLDASRATEVAREAARPIVGLAPALLDALGEDDPPPVLVAGRLDFGPALLLALQRAAAGFSAGTASVGLADEALELVPGVPGLYDLVVDDLERFEPRMRSGRLVIERR